MLDVRTYRYARSVTALLLLGAIFWFSAPSLIHLLSSDHGSIPTLGVVISLLMGLATLAVACSCACYVIVLYPAHMQVGRFNPRQIRFSDIRQVTRRDGRRVSTIDVRLNSGSTLSITSSIEGFSELFAELNSRVELLHQS
jgi:hypothetical protein